MVKFSIITPVYNGEKFIEECILNIQNQTEKNLEHILIDGGSTDSTVSILNKYKNSIKFISEKDNGQSDAINKGFKMAIGDIVCWLNADDLFYDVNVLRDVAEIFEEKKCKIISGRCVLRDLSTNAESVIPQLGISLDSMIRWWNSYSIPPQPAIFFKRELIDKYGYLDDSLHYCMDHELWLRFLSNGEVFCQTQRVFAIYQLHPESKTGSTVSKFILEHDLVAKRYWGKLWEPRFYRHLAEYIYAKFKFRSLFRNLKSK